MVFHGRDARATLEDTENMGEAREMLDYDPELMGYPVGGHFEPHELFSSRDRFIDPVRAWLLYRDNIERVLMCAERARYSLSASCGREIIIVVVRLISSPEWNADIGGSETSMHCVGGALDFGAYYRGTEKENGVMEPAKQRLVPHEFTARHAEAGGFRRVAVIPDAEGLPCGVHADIKSGPQVAVGYTPVYAGAEIQEWYKRK